MISTPTKQHHRHQQQTSRRLAAFQQPTPDPNQHAQTANMQAIAQQQDAQTNMMAAQLADLNDEIGADDWTIPRQEITRRKLIKQTPRYNVYKADWFGDVIVYEPVARQTTPRVGRRRAARCRPTDWGANGSESPTESTTSSAIDRDDFRARLNELCLELDASRIDRRAERTPMANRRHADNGDTTPPIDTEQSVDSAYSSISSTPQYYTKHSLQREFEFPAQSLAPAATLSNHDNNNKETRAFSQTGARGAGDEHQLELQTLETTLSRDGGESRISCDNVQSGRRLRKSSFGSAPTVVLNRDSFPRAGFEEAAAAAEQPDDDELFKLDKGHYAMLPRNTNEQSNYHDRPCYYCHCDCNSSMSKADDTRTAHEQPPATTSGSWFELNELRLVAHENFMLFMGASIEESARSINDELEQTTSLVMQMSHPKSVSLYDLLHASRTSAGPAGASANGQLNR
jgi:hypothetical protein